MPELLTAGRGPAGAATRQPALLAALADAVLGVPGVVRLEPTLSTSGPRVLLQRGPYDGLHLLTRAGTADVDLNIATSSTHSARDIAHRVQARIAEVLTANGYAAGAVTVSILTIAPPEGPKQ
jgi:uncharacterized alkaline shock family protein YloU